MENKSLAAALVKAQSEMKGAVKDTVNPFFKSKYADLGSVWEACHKALTDNGFSIVQAGAFHDGHFFLKTTLLHTSGESLSGEYLIKPTKEDPQAYGSAWTYARRYSLASMVGVISEDDDGAAASEPAPVRQSAPSERPTGKAAAQGDGIEIVSFIPEDVVTVEGKGKGAGKMFSEIYSSDGQKFSATEAQGEIAAQALGTNRKIVVAFKRNGRFLNATKVEIEKSLELEETPF